MPESDEVNAEEYNAEDDVPDPEAPGQPDDQQPPPAEDLPDDMEGLEDQEVCIVIRLFYLLTAFLCAFVLQPKDIILCSSDSLILYSGQRWRR